MRRGRFERVPAAARHAMICCTAIALASLALGCGAKGPPPEAPTPRRPKEQAGEDKKVADKSDCAPTDPTKLPGAIPEKQRRRIESLNLAAEATGLLNGATKSQDAKREKLIEQAVDKLNTALAADPYNVEATYTLAGVQAMVGRTQCTVNLLARLLELRKLDSYKMAVREKIDQLEGRGKFAGRLDPAFAKVRSKTAYRELARKFSGK